MLSLRWPIKARVKPRLSTGVEFGLGHVINDAQIGASATRRSHFLNDQKRRARKPRGQQLCFCVCPDRYVEIHGRETWVTDYGVGHL